MVCVGEGLGLPSVMFSFCSIRWIVLDCEMLMSLFSDLVIGQLMYLLLCPSLRMLYFCGSRLNKLVMIEGCVAEMKTSSIDIGINM